MIATRRGVLLGASAAAFGTAALRPTPARAGASLDRLGDAMANGRFVTYQPTAITAVDGQLTTASDDSIRADLAALKPDFDSLITYSAVSGAERVPDIAREMGFRAVVVGVWSITDETERANAIAAIERNPSTVAGLSLGNETILGQRGNWGDIAYRISEMRARLPSVPLTTTEPFAQYLDQSDARSALRAMDFLLVNIHPIFETWFRSAKAPNWADFVVRVSDRLAQAFAGPILVKETGVPSGPVASGFDEGMQHDFWRALEAQMPRSAGRAFSYFSAFDAPWRANDTNPTPGAHPEEAHWGLFTEARAPKKVMWDMPVEQREKRSAG
jgi:exo-beta-1,3-glucanase (GH17 family)